METFLASNPSKGQNLKEALEHINSSLALSHDKHKYATLLADTDKTLQKIEEEILSITGNEWVLGASFTALDINLAVSLHKLEELGYGSLIGDKPGIQQVWSKVQLRPGFQEIFLSPIKIKDSRVMVQSQGGGANIAETDSTESSSLSFEDSFEKVENADVGLTTDKSMDNESGVTSPEPTSGNDNNDEKTEKKKRKRQRKRQNEDRTWYSLW